MIIHPLLSNNPMWVFILPHEWVKLILPLSPHYCGARGYLICGFCVRNAQDWREPLCLARHRLHGLHKQTNTRKPNQSCRELFKWSTWSHFFSRRSRTLIFCDPPAADLINVPCAIYYCFPCLFRYLFLYRLFLFIYFFADPALIDRLHSVAAERDG